MSLDDAKCPQPLRIHKSVKDIQYRRMYHRLEHQSGVYVMIREGLQYRSKGQTYPRQIHEKLREAGLCFAKPPREEEAVPEWGRADVEEVLASSNLQILAAGGEKATFHPDNTCERNTGNLA